MSLSRPKLDRTVWRKKCKRPVSEKNIKLVQKELQLPPDKIEDIILP